MNDLKMMYSLRWKHDPKREASSFVFVYDIPGITLHYQLFKNYLVSDFSCFVYIVKLAHFTRKYSLF